MRKRYVGGLLMVLLAPAAVAQPAWFQPLKLQPASKLWVEGTSTVRSFKCTATEVDATVESHAPQAAAAVLDGQKVVGTVELTVPAARLDCANGTMNEHMLKAIKAKEHPQIVFRLSSYELAPAGEGAVTVKLDGRLTLGGVEKPIAMQAKATAGANGALLVTGSQDVKLSDHGLKAPTLMMGTMKVGDTVKVRYELVLQS